VKASVFVGSSLDGYIARLDGTFDFLSAGEASEPAANGFDEFLASVDAIVMGRNTYDVVVSMSTWFYGRRPVFVLSHRELPAAPDGALVERLTGEPPDILSRLAARGFRHVYVDGGATIQAFLRAGLVQRLIITRVPVLIGSGIALFGALEADLRLRHLSTREISGGAVQSVYAVETSTPPEAS
jgi:dihydrofolate reductase